MKVCIDPGHGGTDPGAIGRNPQRLEEKEFNLKVGLLLEQELDALGHDVIMTRRIDRTLSLGARARFANQHGAQLLVSIHANAAASDQAEGMEVFHFPGSQSGREAARPVLQAMLTAFPGHRDRGVKEANFAVLRLTAMPAILVECEFLTHPGQLRFLADPANQAGLATAIAGAIDSTAAQD